MNPTARRPTASEPTTKAKTAPATAPKKPGKLMPAAAKRFVTASIYKASPKAPAETVTLKTVFERLAEGHEMPKQQAHAMATQMVGLMTSLLKGGDRIRISDLKVKDRPALMGRNPATGEAMQIAASKKVAFRVAKELKAAVILPWFRGDRQARMELEGFDGEAGSSGDTRIEIKILHG